MEDGMSRPSTPTIRRWGQIWLAWTAAGLFYITQDFMTRLSWKEAFSWRNEFLAWMAAMYICAAFTPSILWLGRRWTVDQAQPWRPILLHLCASLAFSLVWTALEVPVLVRLGMLPGYPGPRSFARDFWALLPYDLHGGIVRYWIVVGLQALFRSNREARRRERQALELEIQSSHLAEQLASSQLSALKMQLHPHFLFNTLRLYLSIEQVRFEDRLRVRIDAGPELSNALVPHMALQPIVENAVRHGLGQSEEPVLIHVSASRDDGRLTLTVTDDGPGCATPVFEGKGIGLTNTRNRLQRLYGAGATLSAGNRLPRGVQVTMTLPYRTHRPEDEECA
jgi:two-component system, LytTR family, sensor kinase